MLTYRFWELCPGNMHAKLAIWPDTPLAKGSKCRRVSRRAPSSVGGTFLPPTAGIPKHERSRHVLSHSLFSRRTFTLALAPSFWPRCIYHADKPLADGATDSPWEQPPRNSFTDSTASLKGETGSKNQFPRFRHLSFPHSLWPAAPGGLAVELRDELRHRASLQEVTRLPAVGERLASQG